VHKVLKWLKWNKDDPFNIVEKVEDAKWEILRHKQAMVRKEAEMLEDDSGRPTKGICRREPTYIAAKGSKTLPTRINEVGRRDRKGC
jgi:hypothetical protein